MNASLADDKMRQGSRHQAPPAWPLSPLSAQFHSLDTRRGMSEVEHPIARGRKARASREEQNPKIARSPPVRKDKPTMQGFGPVAEEEVASNDAEPNLDESSAGGEQPRTDEVVIPRASVAAARKGIIPDDSAEAPVHPRPLPRPLPSRREARASREEVAKNFRPPPRTGMMEKMRRRFSKEKSPAPEEKSPEPEASSEAPLPTVAETPTAGAA